MKQARNTFEDQAPKNSYLECRDRTLPFTVQVTQKTKNGNKGIRGLGTYEADDGRMARPVRV